MKLRYFATLQDVTRKKEEVWREPAETLAELIDALCRKYGSQFSRWISTAEEGEASLCIVLINGQDYRSLNGLQTRLKEDDTITFFPPIAGG